MPLIACLDFGRGSYMNDDVYLPTSGRFIAPITGRREFISIFQNVISVNDLKSIRWKNFARDISRGHSFFSANVRSRSQAIKPLGLLLNSSISA